MKMKKCQQRLLAVVVIILLLTGCQGKKYEKISGIDSAKNMEETVQENSEKDRQIGKYNGQTSGIVLIEEAGLEIQDKENSDEIVVDIREGELADDFKTSENNEEDNELTLLFSGDVLLSDHVLNAYEKARGIDGVLDFGYQKVVKEADFFMVNQEFPFSNRGEAEKDKQFTFRLPPERVSLFQEMGIDGVTLANNHALDFGPDALLDSCQILDDAGILHTGAGADLEMARRPVTVELKGKKIAVIGATRVIPVADWAAGKQHPGMLAAYDMTVLLEEIRAQREKNDFVAVCIHWGIERDERPQDYQRVMGQQMIDAGADLVIGSHPHVLQGIEYYKGKAILYSLGNFVFGSSIPRTALLQVTWENVGEVGSDPVLRLIPGTSSAGYTWMLTEENKRQEFFQYMKSISNGVVYQTDGTVIPFTEE